MEGGVLVGVLTEIYAEMVSYRLTYDIFNHIVRLFRSAVRQVVHDHVMLNLFIHTLLVFSLSLV